VSDLFIFADSEVRAVQPQAGGLCVAFSAAQVQRDGETGYLQGLEWVFDDAIWSGELNAAFGRLREAHVWLGGARTACLTLPGPWTGPVRAELQFGNGTLVAVQAAALHCRNAGQARFQLSLAC